MIKKTILLLTLFVSVFSCTVKEKPEFLRVENIKLLDSNSEYTTVAADAFFNNPNDLKGELKTDSIKVYVNDVEMAIVSSKTFKVPAKQDFSMPLEAKIPTNRILNLNNLSGILTSLMNKKTIKVQYKGDIKYKVFGFSHSYTIDKTEDVKIKL